MRSFYLEVIARSFFKGTVLHFFNNSALKILTQHTAAIYLLSTNICHLSVPIYKTIIQLINYMITFPAEFFPQSVTFFDDDCLATVSRTTMICEKPFVLNGSIRVGHL